MTAYKSENVWWKRGFKYIMKLYSHYGEIHKAPSSQSYCLAKGRFQTTELILSKHHLSAFFLQFNDSKSINEGTHTKTHTEAFKKGQSYTTLFLYTQILYQEVFTRTTFFSLMVVEEFIRKTIWIL